MRRAILFSALIALAACAKEEAPPAPKALNCAASEGGKVEATDGWVREQTNLTQSTAAYFTVCNGTMAPVTLTRISTLAASDAEMHESIRDANGVVSMGPIGPLTLAPGERVVFEPGGKHVMLSLLSGGIVAGTEEFLDLHFADGAMVRVTAEARSITDAATHEGH